MEMIYSSNRVPMAAPDHDCINGCNQCNCLDLCVIDCSGLCPKFCGIDLCLDCIIHCVCGING